MKPVQKTWTNEWKSENNCKGVLKPPCQAYIKKPGENIPNFPVLRGLICSAYNHDWICLQATFLLKE